MRALLQRVQSARVEVDSQTVSQIGPGLLVYVGFCKSDTDSDAESMCRSLLNLPLFEDTESEGPSQESLIQRKYELLLVSQFSLYGVFKGNRLDFHEVMPSEQAKHFYESFYQRLCQTYSRDKVKDGLFGVKRQIYLANDGPLAFQLDSKNGN